jgi:hypothetical protein
MRVSVLTRPCSRRAQTHRLMALVGEYGLVEQVGIPLGCHSESAPCLHSTLVSTVRHSRPGRNGGLAIIIRSVLPSRSSV